MAKKLLTFYEDLRMILTCAWISGSSTSGNSSLALNILSLAFHKTYLFISTGDLFSLRFVKDFEVYF